MPDWVKPNAEGAVGAEEVGYQSSPRQDGRIGDLLATAIPKEAGVIE